jgi:UDP-N-acetylglucosamine--N-acetylmuramyl-(pentapeptide) pyrophosphoryl-undecaprenol N-acetylglucosamine transferase
MKPKKIIISGGGTGGHIFPAIAIANALKSIEPDIKILFVGAEGKIEMEKVPSAGYLIKSLPIRGFVRSFSLTNFKVLKGLIDSLLKSRKIIKEFKPDVAVGVGGYASGPLVFMAGRLKVPTLIQEQNSYAGITNKLLAKKAKKICVAYDNMDKFFDANKIIKTGNPVRKDLYSMHISKDKANEFFHLISRKKTILILGGSGGARTINEAVIKNLELIEQSDIQFIWQTGKFYYQKSVDAAKKYSSNNIRIFDFINEMDYAFAVADIVITRAGAGTISELCLLKKASILVPSPNVAEDHQTKNAMALVEKEAAIMINDVSAIEHLIPSSIILAQNENEIKKLSENIFKMAIVDSDMIIAKEILKLCEKKS